MTRMTRRTVSRAPVRRAQLVSPFGIGAMMVAPDGVSLITAGLDHWYEREDSRGDSREVDTDEFIVEEWRLERALGVTHFRLPPDFRISRHPDPPPNVYLTVPALRFPRWHFCPGCHRLVDLPLARRGRVRCQTSGCRRLVVQVPFVAMCDYGHLQDFPWREWVHRSLTPSCDKPLYLYATGGATLAAQKVKCDCGKVRNLAGITTATKNGTYLSSNVADGDYLCQGGIPWHGEDSGEGCTRPLRGSLRSASNLYFALIRSAIYLPRNTSAVPQELMTRLESPPLSTLLRLMLDVGAQPTPEQLRQQHRALLEEFSDEEIAAAISIVTSGEGEENGEVDGAEEEGEPDERRLRRPEFGVLRNDLEHPELMIRRANVAGYEDWMESSFARLTLVAKLRETRAFTGFNRIFPENDLGLANRKALLRRTESAERWLPAYLVYGEGLFFEFPEIPLQEWETRDDVKERVDLLASRFATVQTERQLKPREITPRFLLIHTFAHLVMNRLTFECGYSSAALRERLYVSEASAAPMAAVLIYTAAGDAEGTMGGLVRMGKPGYLEPTIRAALRDATWCAADPVCMEIGTRAGQGPDACNLAACHNCALVPETACEEFNRFLDRGVVVGDVDNRDIGFFSDVVAAL
jgi:MrfA Zn-binding domain